MPKFLQSRPQSTASTNEYIINSRPPGGPHATTARYAPYFAMVYRSSREIERDVAAFVAAWQRAARCARRYLQTARYLQPVAPPLALQRRKPGRKSRVFIVAKNPIRQDLNSTKGWSTARLNGALASKESGFQCQRRSEQSSLQGQRRSEQAREEVAAFHCGEESIARCGPRISDGCLSVDAAASWSRRCHPFVAHRPQRFRSQKVPSRKTPAVAATLVIEAWRQLEPVFGHRAAAINRAGRD
jgi:hypothetical protein